MAQAKTYRERRVGILGGTFNPIHVGHLIIAQDALEQLGLARVIFVPSATPPHKPLDGNATAAQRLAMVRLAIRGDRRFAVDDLEIGRGGKSYTVDTLAQLRQRMPNVEFHFIIGSDSLRELHRWKDVARLVRLCTFVTVPRPGFEPKPVVDPKLDAATRRRLQQQVLRGHPCDIASRDIRSRIAQGRSIRYLVPDAVARYIESHRLYR